MGIESKIRMTFQAVDDVIREKKYWELVDPIEISVDDKFILTFGISYNNEQGDQNYLEFNFPVQILDKNETDLYDYIKSIVKSAIEKEEHL